MQKSFPMEQTEAIQVIQDACADIAREMMKITPAVSALQDEKAKEKVFQTLYELTANVETIKKQVGKLGKNDDSILL